MWRLDKIFDIQSLSFVYLGLFLNPSFELSSGKYQNVTWSCFFLQYYEGHFLLGK